VFHQLSKAREKSFHSEKFFFSEKEEKNIYRITSALPLEKYLLAASVKKRKKSKLNKKSSAP
jgi:hypothetical protein